MSFSGKEDTRRCGAGENRLNAVLKDSGSDSV